MSVQPDVAYCDIAAAVQEFSECIKFLFPAGIHIAGMQTHHGKAIAGIQFSEFVHAFHRIEVDIR